jgi:hypothetical protein
VWLKDPVKNTDTVWIIVAMLAVAWGEILFHWLLGRQMFPSLLAVYLSTDAGGKYFLGGVVDNIAPAAVLGCVNGWAGFPLRSVGKLLVTTVVLAGFVVALMPICSVLVGQEHFGMIWGSAKSGFGLGFSSVFRFLSALLVTGFFTRAAYVFRRD